MKHKIFSLNSNSSIDLSFDDELLTKISNITPWYASKKVGIPSFMFLSIIDIMGFLQVANATISEALINRVIIILGFVVAFEVAPLYIGYSICLKKYDLGKPIRNIIFILSLIAFGLGIVCNIIYRIMTIPIAYVYTDKTLGIALTIVLCILPIITSIVNLVISSLTFDPLLHDLYMLSNKINKLIIQKNRITTLLSSLDNDAQTKNTLINAEQQEYSEHKKKIQIQEIRLIKFVEALVNSK